MHTREAYSSPNTITRFEIFEHKGNQARGQDFFLRKEKKLKTTLLHRLAAEPMEIIRRLISDEINFASALLSHRVFYDPSSTFAMRAGASIIRCSGIRDRSA